MNKLLVALIMVYTASFSQILEVSQVFNTKLTKVKKEQIGTLKSFYGSTTINEENIIDINTRFDGFITKLNANKTLMPIKKGELLFSIYSNKILSIQKELLLSKNSNQAFYNSSIKKLKNLGLSDKEIEKLSSKNYNKNVVSFYSPSNAIILKKNINNQSYVKKGKELLQLANIDTLWFIAKVYQKDLLFLKDNMKAKIFIDGQTKPLLSKIDYIYPFIDNKTKTLDVRFIIKNNSNKIFPNMFGKVSLRAKSKTILTLPKTAVLQKGNKYYVFSKVSKNEIEAINIEAKRITNNKYEIISGLSQNQEVINNALFLLDSDAITNGLYDDNDDEDW